MVHVLLFWCLCLVMNINTTVEANLLEKNVSSLTCELEGIIFGLELSVEYFRTIKYRNHTETLYILCDCSEAMDIIVKD